MNGNPQRLDAVLPGVLQNIKKRMDERTAHENKPRIDLRKLKSECEVAFGKCLEPDERVSIRSLSVKVFQPREVAFGVLFRLEDLTERACHDVAIVVKFVNENRKLLIEGTKK